MPEAPGPRSVAEKLGDYTATPRMLWIGGIAVCIGVIAAYVALGLLRLIGLFTNLLYYHRWGAAMVSPAANLLGWWAVPVPVAGGILVGLMARYGSDKIRGHGIPEAMEAVLISGSRIQPRVAFLKPLSAAIAIGSGGPFGAEGPIIMTGGSFGSLIGQLFHLSAAERKTLLAAGAAAGMSATFAAPVSSVLLAIELLLFEWKPRSFIPAALASVTAAATRRYLLGLGPLFPTSAHPLFLGPLGLLGCLLTGLLVGACSTLLTNTLYAVEDVFRKLPVHWMWWPAIGGLAVGLGGMIYPPALGVGYDVIGLMLREPISIAAIAGVLLVKSSIWEVSLGSGTSGGVLAPLLMIGGALGALEAHILPSYGVGFWPLVAMGAMLGGTMRAPLTGVVFMVELTHDFNMFLPLLLAVAVAYAFTVLAMRRSILTEKISRRGLHLSFEYSSDPLEIVLVREVVQSGAAEQGLGDVVAYADETLSTVAYRMAETGRTRLAVLERKTGSLLGTVSLKDLLCARARNLEQEHKRERVLQLRFLARAGLRTRA